MDEPQGFARRLPFFAAIFATVLSYFIASNVGAVAAFYAAERKTSSEPEKSLAAQLGMTPKVAALNESVRAAHPSGLVGAFAGFVVAVMSISGGFRWLSALFGLVAGAIAGAVVGYLMGYY